MLREIKSTAARQLDCSSAELHDACVPTSLLDGCAPTVSTVKS
jgi:hypothetical protein